MSDRMLTSDAATLPVLHRDLGPAPTPSGATAASPEPDSKPAQLGRYVIDQVIGRGGMGVVYSAHDPKLDRDVAIKLLLDGHYSDVARSRMAREAQAMARLSHPHVVRVFFTGLHEGRPYIVMEWIDGEPLSRWLQRAERPIGAVLDVFLRAGRGLAAAHSVGLVHRDFKPSNVLMARDSRILVADFGLARAWDETGRSGPLSPGQLQVASSALGSITGESTLTAPNQAIGTPRYMPPEQHLGESPDPANDQFALCVALYEALYRQRAFAGATLEELARNKFQGNIQPPARRRPRVPRAVHRVLERGMAPTPRERFDSMDALLDALERARRPRRRRGALAALGALAVGGAAVSLSSSSTEAAPCAVPPGVMDTVWDDARRQALADAFARTELPFARDSARRVSERLDDYVRAWNETYLETCANAQRAPDGPPTPEPATSCLDTRRAELRASVDVLLGSDPSQVVGAMPMILAMVSPEACRHPSPPSLGPPSSHREYTRSLSRMLEVQALLRAGRYDVALARAEPLVSQLRDEGPATLLTPSLHLLGQIHYFTGDTTRGRRRLEEAIMRAEEAGNDHVLAEAASLLVAILAEDQGRLDEAAQWSRRAEAAIERGSLPDEVRGRWLSRRTFLHSARGDIEAALRDHSEAEMLLQQTLGEESSNVISTSMNYAITLSDRGQFTEATAKLEAVAATAERVFGPTHPRLALVLLNLGSHQEMIGQESAARRSYTRALEIWQDSGLDLPNQGMALGNLGLLSMRERRYDEAIAQIERAREIFERAYGPEHVLVAGCYARLGLIEEDRARPAAALEHYRRTLRLNEAALGPNHSEVAWAYNAMGHALLALDRLDEARSNFEQALDRLAKGQTEGHPTEAWARHGLSDVLRQRGNVTGAREQLTAALDVLLLALGEQAVDVARVRVDLGTLELEHGDPSRAVTLLERALARLEIDPDVLYRSRARVALAKARWRTGGDRSEALALARAALDQWPTERGQDDELEAARRWVSAPR